MPQSSVSAHQALDAERRRGGDSSTSGARFGDLPLILETGKECLEPRVASQVLEAWIALEPRRTRKTAGRRAFEPLHGARPVVHDRVRDGDIAILPAMYLNRGIYLRNVSFLSDDERLLSFFAYITIFYNTDKSYEGKFSFVLDMVYRGELVSDILKELFKKNNIKIKKLKMNW